MQEKCGKACNYKQLPTNYPVIIEVCVVSCRALAGGDSGDCSRGGGRDLASDCCCPYYRLYNTVRVTHTHMHTHTHTHTYTHTHAFIH